MRQLREDWLKKKKSVVSGSVTTMASQKKRSTLEICSRALWGPCHCFGRDNSGEALSRPPYCLRRTPCKWLSAPRLSCLSFTVPGMSRCLSQPRFTLGLLRLISTSARPLCLPGERRNSSRSLKLFEARRFGKRKLTTVRGKTQRHPV